MTRVKLPNNFYNKGRVSNTFPAHQFFYLRNNVQIFCVQCQCDVEARLTDGSQVYPHRNDLHELPFWKCDTCNNYVGCHHKTKNRTRPLGNIPTKELRDARKHIHRILDPLWKSGKYKRTDLYKKISDELGWKYHTAKIRSIEEARQVYKLVTEIIKEQ